MKVIPAINCVDRACVEEKIGILREFLGPGDLAHIDVTDGIWTAHPTLRDPMVFKELQFPFGLEVHFMVDHPETFFDEWFAVGMRRSIIHAEAVDMGAIREIIDRCAAAGVDAMLSIGPEATVSSIRPYMRTFSQFQVLAVNPGASGQPFMPDALEKVRLLRERVNDAIIEVDGGMNPETASLVKVMGADTIVSGSYIFESKDPKKAYEELCNI